MPFIGCDCAVCRSTNPRNQRLRCALLLRHESARVLIDCGPDFRQQALRAGLDRLDAVVLSHAHADHLLGLDDLRLLILHQRRAMPIWGQPEVLAAVERIYPYAFADPGGGSFRPNFELHPIVAPAAPLSIAGIPLQPVPVQHSNVTTLGFRIGDFGYVSDVKTIPPASAELLRGLTTLVIDGLRRRPHPTHMNVDEALAAIAELAPGQAYLTHLTHELDEEVDNATLPGHVRLAYDGLVVPISGAG